MISSIAPPEEVRIAPTLLNGRPSPDELPDGDYLSQMIGRVHGEAVESVRHREPRVHLVRELFGRARPLQGLFESGEELGHKRAPLLFGRRRLDGPILIQPFVAQDDYVLPPARVPQFLVDRVR